MLPSLPRAPRSLLAAALLAATAAGCAKPASLPTGKEKRLALIYLDDSGSMDGAAGSAGSDREMAKQRAVQFVQALDAPDPNDVRISLSLFKRDIDPTADALLSDRGTIMASIVKYGEPRGKSGWDPDPKPAGSAASDGTSLLAVLRDAREKIAAAKKRGAVSFAVLVLTDGGVEDGKGGRLALVPKESKRLADEGGEGLAFAIAGVASDAGGLYRRLLTDCWKDAPGVGRVGRDPAESAKVVEWASDRFKEMAAR